MSSRVITISLKEEVEREIRKFAVQKYGKTKGNLSKVITEGFIELKKRETIDPGYAKFLQVMKEVKGKGYGGLMKYKREDLYER